MSPEESLRIAVQLAVTRVTVLGYINACGYPYFMLDPFSVEVWVPARNYLIAREVCESVRCCGERILIRIDEL